METSPLQSKARQRHMVKLTTAQVSVFPALSMLSHIHWFCPVSESIRIITAMSLKEKRLAFIVDGNSTDLKERDAIVLHGPIFQKETLNRRRRNFIDTLQL